MTRYFHELTDREFQSLIEKKVTWDKLPELHPQPSWCSYPFALQPMHGCWSLTGRKVTGVEFCQECDCFARQDND